MASGVLAKFGQAGGVPRGRGSKLRELRAQAKGVLRIKAPELPFRAY